MNGTVKTLENELIRLENELIQVREKRDGVKEALQESTIVQKQMTEAKKIINGKVDELKKREI